MNNNIHDDEGLFRRVSNIPNYLKAGTNKPSSALFKDSKGVSVNRCNHRCKSDVLKDEERLHLLYSKETQLRSIVSVQMALCSDLNVVYDPVDDNDYHTVIMKDEETIELTRSQARKLACQCVVEKQYIF